MDDTRPEETTVKPKEKQMSATQVAHEIMSAGKNCAPLWVIVKKSSPKKTCRPTVRQQQTDRLPTGFLGSSSSQLPYYVSVLKNVAVLLAARL